MVYLTDIHVESEDKKISFLTISMILIVLNDSLKKVTIKTIEFYKKQKTYLFLY